MPRTFASGVNLEEEHGVGCVAARRSRTTGTIGQLYRPDTQCEDPGWFVVCREHATTINVETRSMGDHCVSHPEEFCDDCREALAKKEEMS